MALQPDYTAGTITLTSGSTGFTTTGAALQTAGIRAGDEIKLPAKGLTLTIASITGQNAGTLTDACPANAAGANQGYRIRYQSDLSRVAAYTRELIQLLGAGNNEAFAELDGTGGNLLPYFTGIGAMATTALTAKARELLDDPDVAAMLATLGVSPSVAANTVLITNANTIDASGWYAVDSPYTGAPSSVFYIILHVQSSENTAFQIAVNGFHVSDGSVYLRYKNAASWGPWRRIAERGSNANGTYTRLIDGRLFCTHVATETVGATELLGSVYRNSVNQAWTFPAAFSSQPVVNIAPLNSASWAGYGGGGTTQAVWVRYIPVSDATPRQITLRAEGMWY